MFLFIPKRILMLSKTNRHLTPSLWELPHRSKHNHTYLRMRSVSLSFGLSSETIGINYSRPLCGWTKFCSWGFAIVGFAVLSECRRSDLQNSHEVMHGGTLLYSWCPYKGTRGRDGSAWCAAAGGRRCCHKQTGDGSWSTRGCPHHHSQWTLIKEALIL